MPIMPKNICNKKIKLFESDGPVQKSNEQLSHLLSCLKAVLIKSLIGQYCWLISEILLLCEAPLFDPIRYPEHTSTFSKQKIPRITVGISTAVCGMR